MSRPPSPDPTHDTLREHAYERMSDLLASGQLGPGEKMSLRTAADRLGMSITPVREATSRLVADGALEVARNRAVRVPVMTRAEFQELTSVRVAIEGMAARDAAWRRTPEELVQISAAEADFRANSEDPFPNVARAVEMNSHFHFAVYRAAGSPLLTGIIRGLWRKAGPVITLDVRGNPARLAQNSAVRHAAILQAIQVGDGDAARDSLAADIEAAAAYILEHFPSFAPPVGAGCRTINTDSSGTSRAVRPQARSSS